MLSSCNVWLPKSAIEAVLEVAKCTVPDDGWHSLAAATFQGQRGQVPQAWMQQHAPTAAAGYQQGSRAGGARLHGTSHYSPQPSHSRHCGGGSCCMRLQHGSWGLQGTCRAGAAVAAAALGWHAPDVAWGRALLWASSRSGAEPGTTADCSLWGHDAFAAWQ